jgi:5-carboxymethyl-2-hydroxymuconate isomerase
MPQCSLEYTNNLIDAPDIKKVLLSINKELAGTGEFDERKIKSKAVRHDQFVIADGDSERSFVSLIIHILEGRSDTLKESISDCTIELLCAAFPKSLATGKCSITVQVRDIEKRTYRSSETTLYHNTKIKINLKQRGFR